MESKSEFSERLQFFRVSYGSCPFSVDIKFVIQSYRVFSFTVIAVHICFVHSFVIVLSIGEVKNLWRNHAVLALCSMFLQDNSGNAQ